MKILLTGAGGFTGRHFSRAATRAGHQVLPLLSDLTDVPALHAEVAQAQPDAVLHLAGIAFVGHADDAALYAVNTVGTGNLLSALSALSLPPAKVLLASSANIYGNCLVSPVCEEQPAAPVSHYATSKMAMEAIAHTYAQALPIVIARPFNYTGPGQSTDFLIPKLVSHFARHAPAIALGNLDVEREFNDVAMVCRAYLALLTHGEAGLSYNVCSGTLHSLGSVVEMLQEITGHTLQVQQDPAFIRANEVRQLCGQPKRLNALLAQHGIEHTQPPLRDTLQGMLSVMDPSTGQWQATC